MAIADVADWATEFTKRGTIWFAKRLAANDTLATHAHQAGPYIPKEFLFEVFPTLHQPKAQNPDHWFDLYIDSHSDHQKVRAVWYNNKFWGNGTRNETRLTNFGGAKSALLDPDSTGAIAVFVFILDKNGMAAECHAWVCTHATEEDVFEERLGPLEPKTYVSWKPGTLAAPNLLAIAERPRETCQLSEDEIPAAWRKKFPSGEEIIRKTLELRPPIGMNPDVRLIKRRKCEYEIFQSIEHAYYLPRIRKGFVSIDGFVGLAQSILQSRKSRSGNSLEFHAREIFSEEGLKSGTDFVHRPVIERGKRPDFIFPSVTAYENAKYPKKNLRMLAAKTTCKDRWRQILNEADRVTLKHLLTLQEGVSQGQFREMKEAGVQLVVPTGLHSAYPKEIRPHLLSFESFISEIRLLNLERK